MAIKKNLPVITLTKGVHRNENQLFISFVFNKELIALARTVSGARWSASKKTWYILNKPSNLKLIFSVFKGKATVDASTLFIKQNKEKAAVPKKVKEKIAYPKKEVPQEFILFMKRRRYSENSIKTYSSFLLDFSKFIHPLQLSNATQNHLKRYMNYLIKEKQVAISTQNQAINALKCYYENIEGWDKFYYALERPKKEKKLPKILSEAEILKMIQVCDNLKHKVILCTLYSTDYESVNF